MNRLLKNNDESLDIVMLLNRSGQRRLASMQRCIGPTILTDLTSHLCGAEIGFLDAAKEAGRPITDFARDMKTLEQGAATSG